MRLLLLKSGTIKHYFNTYQSSCNILIPHSLSAQDWQRRLLVHLGTGPTAPHSAGLLADDLGI